MKRKLIILMVMFYWYNLNAQHNHNNNEKDNLLEGIVYQKNEDAKRKTTLPGVNIFWAGTTQGVVSDSNGRFEIRKADTDSLFLVASFVAYQPDTVYISKDKKKIEIVLSMNNTLQTIEIKDKRSSTFVSKISTINAQHITGAEFHKAACCNLGESFETNATVDVSYSDAVTGSKQIQMLGLAGKYTQMMSENYAIMRGLSSTFGLGYIPGSWMESIHISKGTASVLQGYESVTGQINVEYKKPDHSEVIYLNAFANDLGKTEGNINASAVMNEKWSTMIFGHVERNNQKHDRNKDGFVDMPQLEQYNIFNRWKYTGDNLIAQTGIKLLEENRTGGQVNFQKDENIDTSNAYGININTRHYEAFFKAGYIFPDNPSSSIGFVNTASLHERDGVLGLNQYNAKEQNLISRLVFQSLLNNPNHEYSVGVSFLYDRFDEDLNDTSFNREEIVPGTFLQYTYHLNELITLIGGVRSDYHNIYGVFFTPRFHARYQINEQTIFRASAGKGYRTANAIAENNYALASSRDIVFVEEIKQEEAWNYGLNVSRYFHLNERELALHLDFYRTDFTNQLVVDMEDVHQIKFYNLKGVSYANSFQIEATHELFERFDVVAAFRYNDVRLTIQEKLREKPLVNRYKGLLSMTYYTNLKKWQFDFTTLLNGNGRLPSTSQNPVAYQREESYDPFLILNGQITKYFRTWEIYAGVENITDFVQKNPLIAPEEPFGNNFDASMVWGPLIGRKIYAGMRFRIERD